MEIYGFKLKFLTIDNKIGRADVIRSGAYNVTEQMTDDSTRSAKC